MADYYKYAVRLNNLAHKYIADYRTAQSKLTAAEKEYEDFKGRQRTGRLTEFERYLGDSVDTVKTGTLTKARGEFGVFRKSRFDVLKAAQGIRDELAAQIEEDYRVNPERVKADVLAVLNSGICTPAELCHLANESIENGNPTMARIVGGYIDKVLSDDNNRHHLNMDTRTQLVGTRAKIDANDGSVYLERFDSLVNTLGYLTGNPDSRGAHYNENPDMFDKWDSLTGDMIENGFSD